MVTCVNFRIPKINISVKKIAKTSQMNFLSLLFLLGMVRTGLNSVRLAWIYYTYNSSFMIPSSRRKHCSRFCQSCESFLQQTWKSKRSRDRWRHTWSCAKHVASLLFSHGLLKKILGNYMHVKIHDCFYGS